jgi:hypothetical protein
VQRHYIGPGEVYDPTVPDDGADRDGTGFSGSPVRPFRRTAVVVRQHQVYGITCHHRGLGWLGL